MFFRVLGSESKGKEAAADEQEENHHPWNVDNLWSD